MYQSGKMNLVVAVLTLVVTVLGAIIVVITPEIRAWFKLDETLPISPVITTTLDKSTPPLTLQTNPNTALAKPLIYLSVKGLVDESSSGYLRRRVEKELDANVVRISKQRETGVNFTISIDVQDQISFVDVYGANTYKAECEIGITITDLATNQNVFSDTVGSDAPVPGFSRSEARRDCLKGISESVSRTILAGIINNVSGY